MLVRDVMSTHPVTTRAGATVKSALQLLHEHRISALPVVDAAGRVNGVVSEADLIRELVPPDQRAHLQRVDVPETAGLRVADVMTMHAVTVRPDTDLAEAVELITTTAIKSVPVVDHDGLVVGVLSRADVVRALARSDDDVRRRVTCLLDELGLDDWMVEVRDGVVELDGPDLPSQAAVARIAAARVPGVVAVAAQAETRSGS